MLRIVLRGVLSEPLSKQSLRSRNIFTIAQRSVFNELWEKQIRDHEIWLESLYETYLESYEVDKVVCTKGASDGSTRQIY